MLRRELLVRAGAALGAGAVAACRSDVDPRIREAVGAKASTRPLAGWDEVRDEFALSRDHVELSAFFLASHPRQVREAIERHRRGLDASPLRYFEEHHGQEQEVARAAGSYLGVDAADLALTDSTTMGLGLLYGGLRLAEGQEVLTTEHDHYATSESLRLRAERDGARVREIALYQDPERATADGIVDAVRAAVGPRTRVVALTWVHSVSGVKLPLRRIADVLNEANQGRASEERALLCVDGVHGIGAEDAALPALGCDFFVAGAHKWLFGPRGTGFVWGRPEAWPAASATIPTFSGLAYPMWMGVVPRSPLPPGVAMTPGGFHTFEHRWALDQAFRFHERIGKARVAARIRELAGRIKDGLSATRRVRLRTPRDPELSSGIVCFEVEGVAPRDVVEQLWTRRRIVASVTPYRTRYARVAGSLLTSPEEVDVFVDELRAIARG